MQLEQRFYHEFQPSGVSQEFYIEGIPDCIEMVWEGFMTKFMHLPTNGC